MPSTQPYIYSENGDSTPTPHALLPFLQSQSQNTLTRLYQRPSSCLSIFRLLAPLERQIIMNLLWLESAIAASTMAAWVIREGKKLYEDALATLGRLNIIPQSSTKLALNGTFKSGLRQAMTGGGSSGSFGVPADKDDKRQGIDIEALDGYALERWETILHYMVSSGTGQSPTRPSQGVLFLLQRSGLMALSHSSLLQITSAGFQFLLHSPHDQLWDLLLQYLHLAEERQMDLVEVLGFIFMLSTMELGREYSTENLSGTQKAMLEDLRDYGLIWQRKPSSRRFSPTRLSTTLTSSAPPLPTARGTSSGPQEGFIILETNYRVYAYTDNPLQTAVLNLFVSLKYRFPNLVVGSITRDSVKKALMNGISADQIISYLTAHAHPQMRKNNPLLPVTVQDQIRLWELERNRLKSREGYLYTAFASQADYEFVLNYAKELDVVVWENSVKRCFFGTLEGHSNIKGFIERRTLAAGS
ncbi:General transcription and DNA repair factor IIH subunit TFB2 [Psilocybe cubensis]|uniref:RNA polymerase II transcription factor B subunit 2 n=2 Tax=Psilocybe cubensis TaxID=181762 RepID=A0A8H8CKT1_PSICU|nr:General transcription and DNA repair factor IIH subunit TFB2 [Psilocybe cubensis]KAH9481370.1 General transcription and DNA repair factor IIH subunit TFB2 [Psilocybe cubensis]